MGHPNLEVTEGQILFNGEDITEADPDERARMGLFMAFQYPVAIPGVTVTKYLRMVINAHREARGEPADLAQGLPQDRRGGDGAHQRAEASSPRATSTTGFSGGEKKRMEILQLALQQPRWRSSTRPTRASTSTRSTSSPTASTRSPRAPTWAC